MESYSVQYTATVRGCNLPSQSRTITIDSTERSFPISRLEENSDVSGSVAAVNIRGRNTASFSTNTFTASVLHCQSRKIPNLKL